MTRRSSLEALGTVLEGGNHDGNRKLIAFKRSSDTTFFYLVVQIFGNIFGMLLRSSVVSTLISTQCNRFVEVERKTELQEIADDIVTILG